MSTRYYGRSKSPAPPLDGPDMERLDESFSSLIDFTSRNMRRYSTGRLHTLGLTVDQWGILKLLEESDGALSFSVMSERLLRDKPTVTRVVDILVREGLVVREEDPDDRRRLTVRLTSAGAQRVSEASKVVLELRREVSRGVTADEMSALRIILAKINGNIEAARQPS